MSDEAIECVECGRTFTWSYSEQRYYSEHGLEAPKHCKECRSQRRYQRGLGSSRVSPLVKSDYIQDKWTEASQSVLAPTSYRADDLSYSHQPKQPSWGVNPIYVFGVTAFGLATVFAAVIWWYGYPLDVLQSWLIALTLITLLVYGYDKAIAGSQRTRVPEKVLLALTLAGGTVGAMVGMRIFHHKTAKGSFLLKFWVVVIVQIVLIAAYYVLIMPMLSASE